MNTDQQARLEIMKALEKEFPDRVLEDLIEVALYVEAGGIEQDRSGSQDSAAKYSEEATDIPEARTWWELDRIPDDVLAVTDHDGDVIRRVALDDRVVWKFAAERYWGIAISNDLAPFAEVLDD